MQHRQGITDSSHSASPELMDSWQQESMSRRQAQPVRPPPKVTASLLQITGTEAADGGEMMAYRYSSNRDDGHLLSKEACGNSTICWYTFFHENVLVVFS